MSTGNFTENQNMVGYFENIGIGAGGPGNATLLSTTGTELNVLAGIVAGTVTASKAVVVGANKNLDTLAIADSGLKLGAGAGTAVTATAVELNVTAGATAGTAVASKAMVLDANKGISGFRNTSTLQEYAQAAPGTLNSTGTLTAAIMLTGIVTSTTAAAVTATLDTGTNFETALIAIYPGLQNNDSVEFSVINTGGANAFTIATATGWTDGGGGFTAVAFGTSARFLARRTSANNYTLYKIA